MSSNPTPPPDTGDAAPVVGDRAAKSAPPETAPRLQARDVVTFGHEVGRVLSDGRIVGRAEPFARAFASSREVKRAVGATAWVILEDIALDATIDDHGRLVADTSVRHIAANLGLNKSTVARHVARLRDHGFVLHDETRDDTSGRWHASRYVLGPVGVRRAVHPHAGGRTATVTVVSQARRADRHGSRHRVRIYRTRLHRTRRNRPTRYA